MYEHASIPGFLAFFARMEIEIQLNRFVASTFLSICIIAYCTATLHFVNTSINCANFTITKKSFFATQRGWQSSTWVLTTPRA